MSSSIMKLCGCTKKRKNRSIGKEFKFPDETKPSTTSSDRSWTYYNLGCALQEQGKIQEAINCYREAIALNPAHIEANYNMGSALQEIDALQEAEKYYKTTIALKPNHHMAYYNMGYLYQDRGSLDQSVYCFRQAARIEPHDVDTHINLGLVLKMLAQYDEAVKSYKRAIAIDMNCIMAFFNLGNVYQDMKQYSAAIECFQNVLRIDPTHGDALFNLAIAYHDKAMSAQATDQARLADLQQALNCYKNVCQLMPYLEEASRAAEQIAALIEKYSESAAGSSGSNSTGQVPLASKSKAVQSAASMDVDENSNNRHVASITDIL